MANYRHGVYNLDQDTSLAAPVRSTAGLQVIFGTAPIHLAKDPSAAVNQPVLVNSMSEAAAALGYSDNFKAFTLCQSMYANFNVFNNCPIVFINVLDPNNPDHVSKNEEKTYPVTNKQVLYTVQYVLLSSLVVKAGESELKADADFIAQHRNDGSVMITMVSEAATAAANVAISSTSIKPTGVKKSDIVGGVDVETGKETGMELVRHIYPLFALTPGLLLAPGWSHDPMVAAALQAKVSGINGNFECSCILDIPTSGDIGAKTYTAVKTAKEDLGAVTSHGIALWPLVEVGDKQLFFSAMAAAETVSVDAGNGDVPSESPSNKNLRITGLCLEDGTKVVLDQEQANFLNGIGVVTAINVNGWRLWGNNTCAYPSTTDPKDRWWAVRRFFDWDGNNFVLTYFQKVDKPGDRRLIQYIVDSQNIIGAGYKNKGYCAGYKTKFLPEENPTTDLLSGILRVHTYLAPYIPAEVIENTREYDVEALELALGGE